MTAYCRYDNMLPISLQAEARPVFDIGQSFSSFAVPDVPRAKQFYADTLGLGVSDATPDPNGSFWVQLGGSRGVLVYPKPDHEPAGFTVLNLSVGDIEAAVDALVERGVEIQHFAGFETDARGIFRSPGRHIAWFSDPAGNLLCAVQER